MLSPYRVLDCTDDRGHLAGLILAQLGAQVTLVEPPGGSPARHRLPFAPASGPASAGRAADGSGTDPLPLHERGLWHRAFNRGKRSVVLDLASADGRARLADLAKGVDVLLWSGRPADLPVDYDTLAARNPGLIMAALTPFGIDGPKAHWADADVVISASSCQLALTGDTDRAPLQMGSPEAYLHGAADMAAAVLVGLTERTASGRGQLADVSAQVSCMQASFCYTINEAWGSPPMGRAGDGINLGGYKLRWVYPALDGEVSITLVFGEAMKVFVGNLFDWIWEEGGCDEATRDKPWADLWLRLDSGLEAPSELDRLGDVIAAFTATRAKAELYAEAKRRRVLLAPVATLQEVLDNDHLAVRGYWDLVAAPDGQAGTGRPGDDRTHRAPGRFLVASDTPLHELSAAPLLGQHTAEVLAECATSTGAAAGVAGGASGSSAAGVAGGASGSAAAGVAGGASGSAVAGRPMVAPPAVRSLPGGPGSAALAGVKVLDVTWSVAGPYVCRALADFGATVVKVESRKRPDLGRTASPFHARNDEFPLEGSGLFHNCNAGKLGLELDLSNPDGKAVFEDLAGWADIVVESFSAGAFARMGFGYEWLARVNPGAILLSSCLPGQTGTLELPGYGNLTTALFGFTAVTRWPGRQAAGPFGAYTDIVSPRFGLAGVLAALDHRRRTGRGQHLDLSQAECSLHFMAPALLDAELNGHVAEARGNADPERAPHGVYPTTGTDGWIAVVCPDDDAWRALAARLGRADLAGLATAERLDRRDELDELVGAWTAPRDAEALQEELQGLGIAAHQVQNTHECLADPQLSHRGHYVHAPHPLLGPVVVEGPRFRLSRTPGSIPAAGPVYGEHNEHVLADLLGYDDERIANLVIAGALG